MATNTHFQFDTLAGSDPFAADDMASDLRRPPGLLGRIWNTLSGGPEPVAFRREEQIAEPAAVRVLLASIFGGGLGALAAASMFPALPALMFGAAIGAYSGFLAAAMEALSARDIRE